MRKKNIIREAGVFLIVASVIGSIAVFAAPQRNVSVISLKKTATLSGISTDEFELKYYNEENLDSLIGITGTMPVTWKTAIRLTQDEMASYMAWNLTTVNVAFDADNGQPTINVKIYIYDKGTSTHPGSVIVNDTTTTLDTTGVTTVPLVTPVPLVGHEELWVAVEWTQTEENAYYAWIDTLTGPHVPDKSDFYYLGGTWGQLHDVLPDVDGRWGIGAIVEGTPSQPPDAPVISGPTNGTMGATYTYTFYANDPEGNDVYYYIEWGDGSYTDWIGPYPSGQNVTAKHSWDEKGTYAIRVKARDIYYGESDWSDPVYMTIRAPILMLSDITGGIGRVSCTIKNTGDADATNVVWTISLDGKLIFLGKSTTDTIASLAAGADEAIKSTLIFGFGKTNIVISATCDEGVSAEVTKTAFVLGPFVLGVK